MGRHALTPSDARWPRHSAEAVVAEFLDRAARLEVGGVRVARAALFGNYVADPGAPELGDVDVLVELSPRQADGADLRRALAEGFPALALHRWDLDAQRGFPILPEEHAFRLAVQLVRGVVIFPP